MASITHLRHLWRCIAALVMFLIVVSAADSLAAEITGTAVPELAPFDHMMVDFLARNEIPGATLAITDQGRLVFSRGYGLADVETGEPVTPASRFRIASISKPITAVAILRLVDEGKLQLADRVFELLDYSAEIAGIPEFDQRQHDITIEHLLQHRGGWDRDKSFDAMFQSSRFSKSLGTTPPATPDIVIRAMLREPLDFPPGEQYAYSNYGYCLLGRVIERMTGQSYEQYVRESICKPLGMASTTLGRSRLEGRLDNEVRYYDPEQLPSVFADNLGELVPSAYGGWCLESMDAHGGWVSTGSDLARFACALERPAARPILTDSSLLAMGARPAGLAGFSESGMPQETYYGLGWSIRVITENTTNWWHTGSLPGTATLLIRRHDRRNFVVLMNTRVSPISDQLTRDIDPLLHRAAAEIMDWPDHDLF